MEENAPEPPADPSQGPPAGLSRRRRITRAQVAMFVQAIRDRDQAAVNEMVLRLSRARPWLAPLALIVGAFAMLFDGVRLLFTNWRLTLIQVLPAMWIWAAMYDLKAHVLHGKGFHELTGTAVVVPRWGGLFWFTFALGIVVAVMMVCYVAIPSRLIGMKAVVSRRDKLAAGLVGGAVGAVVCTPPYILGRVGLLMLGSSTKIVFIIGVIFFAVGLALQAGATGAVKTIKMSAKLVSGHQLPDGQ